jgi:predicted nucleotidyltransferase
LRTEQNVRFAVLFGSAARGTDTAHSDVDIAIAARDADLERVLDLEEKLSRLTGRRVDVVRLEDAGTEPELLAELVADGRVLVDREHRWARLQKQAALARRRAENERSARVRSALALVDRQVS